ncbi:hypothetical protein ACHQM5_030267 [Ranunculus cassubicifolius]
MRTLPSISFCNSLFPSSTLITSLLSRQFIFSNSNFPENLKLHGNSICYRAINTSEGDYYVSPWEDKPYEMLPGGERSYYDEQDVLSYIDPPKELIPLDPSSYNPAKYLWKKIEDIPEERRHRLLHLLKPRLISRLWEIAGIRYENSKLVQQSASSMLSDGASVMPLELWNCRTSGGPLPIAWMKFFKKALFRTDDGRTYGRIIVGGSLLSGLANSYSPLYFSVTRQKEVMATEQPCDVAYEFGDGLLDADYPNGFPKPVKHPWPFDDYVVVYVRHVGPGVIVGQAWREGKVLEQVPRKLCSEILMVKDYTSSS